MTFNPEKSIFNCVSWRAIFFLNSTCQPCLPPLSEEPVTRSYFYIVFSHFFFCILLPGHNRLNLEPEAIMDYLLIKQINYPEWFDVRSLSTGILYWIPKSIIRKHGKKVHIENITQGKYTLFWKGLKKTGSLELLIYPEELLRNFSYHLWNSDMFQSLHFWDPRWLWCAEYNSPVVPNAP